MERRKRSTRQRRRAESGVTLIEMMIALIVLTIGLVTLCQLFIVAYLNTQYAVTTSGGVNDAQWLVESWKVKAAGANGILDPDITSATWDSGTGTCQAFVDLDGYVTANSQYKESVWVFDWEGNLVGSASPATPPGFADGELRAHSSNSRLVYILMEPKFPDPRTNQTVTMTSVVSGEE